MLNVKYKVRELDIMIKCNTYDILFFYKHYGNENALKLFQWISTCDSTVIQMFKCSLIFFQACFLAKTVPPSSHVTGVTGVV